VICGFRRAAHEHLILKKVQCQNPLSFGQARSSATATFAEPQGEAVGPEEIFIYRVLIMNVTSNGRVRNIE